MLELSPWEDPLNELSEVSFPKPQIQFPVIWQFLASAATTVFLVFAAIFLGRLSWIVLNETPCILTHTIETNGEFRTLPQQRDTNGCIVDFDKPINTEPIVVR